MAVVFALPHLYDAVAARFAADGFDVDMSFGWLASAEQLRSGRRIVWRPGDDGDNLGAVGPAKYPGRDPRSLATLGELCTVEITAADALLPADERDPAADRTNERQQYTATRLLFDEWLRAVYLAAHGTYRIVSAKWVGGDRARRLGATLRVVISVDAPVFDHDTPSERVDVTRARIDVAELDHTEILDISRESP